MVGNGAVQAGGRIAVDQPRAAPPSRRTDRPPPLGPRHPMPSAKPTTASLRRPRPTSSRKMRPPGQESPRPVEESDPASAATAPPATDRQLAFIRRLVSENPDGAQKIGINADVLPTLSKRKASWVIRSSTVESSQPSWAIDTHGTGQNGSRSRSRDLPDATACVSSTHGDDEPAARTPSPPVPSLLRPPTRSCQDVVPARPGEAIVGPAGSPAAYTRRPRAMHTVRVVAVGPIASRQPQVSVSTLLPSPPRIPSGASTGTARARANRWRWPICSRAHTGARSATPSVGPPRKGTTRAAAPFRNRAQPCITWRRRSNRSVRK